MEKNSMIGWIYRSIDLSQITSAIWRLPIRPSESYDWVLNHIQAEYDSDEEDPSAFDLIQWRLEVVPQNRALQDISDYKPRSPITLTLNGGLNDLTAGTGKPKQKFFPSPPINWPIKSLEVFTIELENFTALTGTVRMLFVGSFILPEDVFTRQFGAVA